ncbi:HupE/UreJ family protein [Novosphingobium profundi]|uniref:HupE/UreJ family protein n=1 Tax=Novosphingobium profundi TaxID=1774954 RepID=UPI001CFD8AFA|nr:HupE/UreJ family protein [Novosphingobium profundi]
MFKRTSPARTAAMAVALVAGLAATPALAHPGHLGDGLVAGLAHPFLGLDHLLAMLAVGLWAATRKAAQAWQAPAMFLACLALGGVLGLATGAIGALEGVVAGSLVVLAALLVAAPFVGNRAGLALIGLFALAHGHAHGGEASGLVPAYFAGFLAASAALHLIGWKVGCHLFASPLGRWAAGLSIGGAGLALAFG